MMTEHERLLSASRMIEFGGSFANYIDKAYQVADLQNRLRLENAFDELFEQYHVNERNTKLQEVETPIGDYYDSLGEIMDDY